MEGNCTGARAVPGHPGTAQTPAQLPSINVMLAAHPDRLPPGPPGTAQTPVQLPSINVMLPSNTNLTFK